MLTLKEPTETQKVEGGAKHVGQIPKVEKLVKFWDDIWEKDDRTPQMPWMESVRKQLQEYKCKGI